MADLKYGNEVEFTEDYLINGKRWAKKYDRGKIVAFNGQWNGITSVRLNKRRYAMRDVPAAILKVITHDTDHNQ